MTSDMQIPQIDDFTNQVRIVRWFKKEGEFVTDNESLLEIEDGLSNLVIQTSGAGILKNIYKNIGEIVKPGERVADFQFFFPAKNDSGLSDHNPKDQSLSSTQIPIKATESAIKFAKEHQIDLHLLVDQATGENGEITDEDVIRYFTRTLIEIDNQRLAVTESDESNLLTNSLEGLLDNQSIEDALTAEIEKALVDGEKEVIERKPIKIPHITNLPVEDNDQPTDQFILPITGIELFSVFEADCDFTQTEKWLSKTMEFITDHDSLKKFGYSAIILKTIDWVLQHEKEFISPITNPDDFGIGYSFVLSGQTIIHNLKNLSHKTCGQIANELAVAQQKYQQGQKSTASFQNEPKIVFMDLLAYGIDRGIIYPTGSQFALLTAGTIHKYQIRLDSDITQSNSTRQITLAVNKDQIKEAAAIHFFHMLRTALENPSIILV